MNEKIQRTLKNVNIFQEKEKKAISDFLRTTSFHGIIQTYNHKNMVNKISWSICISTCFIGFVAHLYLIIQRFAGLPTTIDIVSSVNFDPFPALTICPTKFINIEKFEKNKKVPQKKFNNSNINELITENVEFWKNVFMELNEDINSSTNIGRYWDEAETSLYRSQRYMNVTFDRRNYEMIFFCEINNRDCSYKDFIEIDHPINKRCFRFQYNETEQKAVPDKLVVGVFVDSDFKRFVSDFKSIITFYGGEVTINEAFVFPGTEKSFENFQSGSQTIFRIKQLGSNSVNKLRAPCLVDKDTVLYIQKDFEYDGSLTYSIPYKYNAVLCRQYHTQLNCIKTCNCINQNLPLFTEAIRNGKQPLGFCNEKKSNSTVQSIINNMKCLNQLDQDKEFNENIINLCPGLCEQVQYSIHSYSLPWFENTMINEISFVHEKFMKHYNEIIKLPSITEHASLVKAKNCIEEGIRFSKSVWNCFSLLTVQFESPRKEIIREYEAYLLGNLLSDFGGILGLWIGVSLITIVELFFMFCNLSYHKSRYTVSSFKMSLQKKSLKRMSRKQNCQIDTT